MIRAIRYSVINCVTGAASLYYPAHNFECAAASARTEPGGPIVPIEPTVIA